jgi:hypothetical protein
MFLRVYAGTALSYRFFTISYLKNVDFFEHFEK